MNKNILSLGIIVLFILSTITPIVISNYIKTSSEIVSESTGDGPMDSAWPMFGLDARHTGRSPYGKSGNWYKVKWTHSITDWGDSPAIDKNGTIYLGAESNLYAIYSNGTRKWKYVAGGDMDGTPAIAEDGTIYASSRDGYIYALNPNGTLKWKTTGGGWGSSPVIDEDGTIYTGSTNSRIYAINPNGTKKWIYKTGDWISTCPAIDNDTLYCGSYDTYLYAIYKNNGTLKWRYNTPHEIFELCIGDDGTIYFGNELDYFFAINPNGTKKWRKSIGNYIIPSPGIAKNGTLYVIADTPGSKHSIFSINPDGTINWEYQHYSDSAYDASFVSSPAIDKYGIIYLGARDGWFLALNPDGTLRWSYKAMDTITSSPAIGEDGTIYFSSYTGLAHGYLYALEPLDNNAPDKPVIDGPDSGLINIEYNYTAITSEPDGENISYYFDWGDGKNSGWTEFVPSGTQVSSSHVWTKAGTYTVKVKAKDDYDMESEWGELKVTMPRDKAMSTSLIIKLLERFPLLEVILSKIINL